MLEVEDWTQPSYPSKRRESAKKLPAPDPPLDAAVQLLPDSEVTPIPTGPPEPEVEESFSVTRPPTSRLFPRTRLASSPTAGPSSLSRLLAQAGPAETSAPFSMTPPLAEWNSDTPDPIQLPRAATTNMPLTPPDQSHSSAVSRSVSPPIPLPPPTTTLSRSPPTSRLPPSPTRPSVSPIVASGSQPTNHHVPSQPSPLRPGSRASRLSTSTSSRFSSGRIPFGATSSAAAVKAMPTTAISEQAISTLSSTPSSGSGPFSASDTLAGGMPGALGTSTVPSPEDSPTLGMTSLLAHSHRRRTSSHHIPSNRNSIGLSSPAVAAAATPSSPLAVGATGAGLGVSASNRLASLASSWGFGRKKRPDLAEIGQGESRTEDSAPAPISEATTPGD